MKAVSNTTPLRYLIAIEQEHLLGQLFEKVFVPVAVHEELTDSRTPETVRGRVLAMPPWFEVRTVQETQTTTFPATLHRGERQAILLAEALQADVLLAQGRPFVAQAKPFRDKLMLRRARSAGSAQRGRVVRPASFQSFSQCQTPGVLSRMR